MPELPEVELIRRAIQAKLIGKRLISIQVIEPYSILFQGQRLQNKLDAEELFAKTLIGRSIDRVERRGKYIVFFFTDFALIVHLKMTGSLILRHECCNPLESRFLRVSLIFEDVALDFYDVRKFGFLEITSIEKATKKISRLGPDALEDLCDPDQLGNLLKQSRKELKKFLLDQQKIAGIGNAYADEILFEAGLSPLRPANSLTQEEVRVLFETIKKKLEEGIESGGLTLRNYVNAFGKPGGFREKLKVYGRAGLDCVRCGQKIEKTKASGRSIHYCPSCQR
jgi:formamidopyrimidine-DNA glycosylase